MTIRSGSATVAPSISVDKRGLCVCASELIGTAAPFGRCEESGGACSFPHEAINSLCVFRVHRKNFLDSAVDSLALLFLRTVPCLH